jgi:hypothetical protein
MTGLMFSSTLKSLACKHMRMIECVPMPQLHFRYATGCIQRLQCDCS